MESLITSCFHQRITSSFIKQLLPHNTSHTLKREVWTGWELTFVQTHICKELILKGGDSIKLMHILGHSSLDMVEHYANLYGHDLHVGFEDYDLLTSIAKNNTKLTVNGKKKE